MRYQPWPFLIAAFLSAGRLSAAYTPCEAPALPVSGNQVTVSDNAQLQAAVGAKQPNTTILLEPGTYDLSSSLNIHAANVTIQGTGATCNDVVLIGKGYPDTSVKGKTDYGVWTNQPDLTVANLTIRDIYFHPIMLNEGSHRAHIYNVRLINAGEQFIKGAGNPIANTGSNDVVVEYSIMEYETMSANPHPEPGVGLGYTNGVDALGGQNWIIRNNIFKNIQSPGGALAGPSILMWHGSGNTLSENNLFIDCAVGIAYGKHDGDPTRGTGGHVGGGIIRNNIFYRTNVQTADVGIILEEAPNVKILNNTFIVGNQYPSAIEYRWPQTTGAEIRNNIVDKAISLRNGATATVANNITNATTALFVNPAANDLHLKATATAAIDKGQTHADVTTDFDGDSRTSAPDLGADEFNSSAPPPPNPPAAPTGLKVK